MTCLRRRRKETEVWIQHTHIHRERPGGWVRPRAGLEHKENLSPHRDSIPVLSSPQGVAIPIELSRLHFETCIRGILRAKKLEVPSFSFSLFFFKFTYMHLVQCLSTFVRPRPGKLIFYKTRARSQQIYS